MALPVIRRIHHRNAARVRVTYVVNASVGVTMAIVFILVNRWFYTNLLQEILVHVGVYPYWLFILLCVEHSMVQISRSWLHGLLFTAALYGSTLVLALGMPGVPYLYEVIALILYASSGLLLGPAAAALARRFVRHVPDLSICINCGYSLRGLPENRCPECGTRIDRSVAMDLHGERPSEGPSG